MSTTENEFDDNFLKHLFSLNQIASRHFGNDNKTFRCVGNLFYDHDVEYPVRAAPIAEQKDKRDFFAAAIRGRQSLLEVGFNAGHSALLALMSNPNLSYTGIDTCGPKYSVDCVNYMARQFKGRFNFIRADSREALPFLATHHREKKYDVFHIDGDHHAGPVRADIGNVLRIAPANALVILDDTDMTGVAKAYSEYVKLGRLKPVKLKGFEDIRRQAVAIPIPDSALKR